MSDYVLSPRARADLEEIWDYTFAHWGVNQAEAYARQILAAIETVAADPKVARACGTLRAGYWKYPAGKHVLFFRLTPRGVDVVRILHSRMDFERHI